MFQRFQVETVRYLSVGGLTLGACLSSIAAPVPGVPITFAKDVAPIFQAKCQECHRAGTAAPMPLITYQEVRPWVKAIKERVASRNMPPWQLDKGVGIQEFMNDRSLTGQQIDTIVSWVDSGALPGDPKDLPPPKVWPKDDEWQLAGQFGQPDLVLKSEPYTMPAHGQDVWWKPVTAIPLNEARWVRAVEMRPGTVAGRRIVHQVVAQLLPDAPGVDRTDLDGRPGLLMEWAMGEQYDIYRPGTGKLLLANSQIGWNIHMHAVGETIRDHVELAVYLYPKGEVPKYRTRLMLFSALRSNNELDIPPNSMTETSAFHILKQPARLEDFQPHMHLRGKAMAMEAILPDGAVRTLSYVDRFNFKWMNNYIYADDAAPVLPKGTRIRIIAWYDNTRANPNNPDPNQWVGYGRRMIDEMGHAWVNVTDLSDQDYQDWAAKHKPATSSGRF